MPRSWEITGRDVEICFEVQKQWNYAVCASSTIVIKFCLGLGEITGRDVEICFEVQQQRNHAVCASSTSVFKFCLGVGKSPVETLKFVSKFRNNGTMQCVRRLQVAGMEEYQLRTIQAMVGSALWKWLSRTKWRILFTPIAKPLTKRDVLKQVQNSNFKEMTSPRYISIWSFRDVFTCRKQRC